MAEGETKTGGSGPISSMPKDILVRIFLILLGILLLSGLVGCASAWFIPLGQNCASGGASWMIQTGGLFLAAIALITDLIINKTIIEAGSIIGGGGIAGGISIAWEILRDFMNLVFIGGLIYAAFAMILQLNVVGGKPGSLIVKILITALLVNFSYFFAGAIIDASNFTTKIVYEEAIKGGVEQEDLPNVSYGPLSTNLMNVLGLGAVHELGKEPIKGADGLVWFYGLFAGIFLVATAAVFAEMSYAFFKRFIAIIYLLITSPLAIVGFTGIPIIKDWGTAWWRTMIHQAVFPPVFFILIATAYSVAAKSRDNFLPGDGRLGDIFKATDLSGVGFVGFFEQLGNLALFFTLVLGLIIFAAKISQAISAEAANTAWTSKDIYKGAGSAFNTVFKGASVVARPFGGRAVTETVNRLNKPLQGGRIAEFFKEPDLRPEWQKEVSGVNKKLLFGETREDGSVVDGYIKKGWNNLNEDERERFSSIIAAMDDKKYEDTYGKVKTADEKATLDDVRARGAYRSKRDTSSDTDRTVSTIGGAAGDVDKITRETIVEKPSVESAALTKALNGLQKAFDKGNEISFLLARDIKKLNFAEKREVILAQKEVSQMSKILDKLGKEQASAVTRTLPGDTVTDPTMLRHLDESDVAHIVERYKKKDPNITIGHLKKLKSYVERSNESLGGSVTDKIEPNIIPDDI